MFKSIFLKEWLKLKLTFIFLLISFIAILVYFTFSLNFEFSTIEPESMMWYRFVELQYKPYFYFFYLYLAMGIIIAFSQFLPEVIAKRIKLTIHLPFSMKQIVFSHLLIGIILLTFICTIFSLGLLGIVADYYPKQIVQVIFEDTLFYSFASIILYICSSSIILEQDKKKFIFKIIFTLLFLFAFTKEEYFLIDSIWFLLLFFTPFLVLESFYGVKQQNLGKLYNVSFFSTLLFLIFLAFLNYKQNYQKEFHKYYIFYSDILEEFVYQKNFGEHRFEYGIKDTKTFSQKEYEEYLPFVYYKDLEIQRKLPINIKSKDYSAQEIKDSKLGFEYNFKMLKKKKVELYPLFNPQSDIGIIKFPEEFFGIFKDGAYIYDFDNEYLKDKSEDLNQKLKELNFSFPAKKIWGKTTNIKPFDLGYLILDNQNRLFNLKKYNDKVELKEIFYPKDIKIAHISISENKQKNLSAYAIDENSNFYLLNWDFKFTKLDLKNFDYKNMRLKLVADPINYLIRYDDEKNYYATVFSKNNLEKIKEIEFKE